MNSGDQIKYVIISPVRDEEKYIEQTIKSIISQTVKPCEWIIVNDGSTDKTGEIVDRYARRYSWIRGIHRGNRGFRKSGYGVIEAFYDGYNSLKSENWDYIVKLDGDLLFADDYFENCFGFFHNQPKLGIGGGVIYHNVNGKLTVEKTPLFHVRGATKIYRRKCWEDIGELIMSPGWDTVDEVKANMCGWVTRSFPELRVTHLKPTGSADGSFRDLVKHGRANYIAGYHPLFMILKCAKRVINKPYIIGSVYMLFGFFSGYLKNNPPIYDKELKKYLRKEQIKRLLFQKSIWK